MELGKTGKLYRIYRNISNRKEAKKRKMLATKREEIERKENEQGSRMDILAR